MKKTAILLVLCLIFGVAHAQRSKRKKKGTVETTAPVAPPKPRLKTYMDSVSYAIGVNIGGSVNAQPIDSLQVDLLLQGLRSTLEKKDTLLISETQAMSFLQSYFQKFKQQMEEKNKQKIVENKKLADDFLAANKAKPGVITTGTGLQ